jgi:hypothetical protein
VSVRAGFEEKERECSLSNIQTNHLESNPIIPTLVTLGTLVTLVTEYLLFLMFAFYDSQFLRPKIKQTLNLEYFHVC